METFITMFIRTTCQFSLLYLLVWTSLTSAFPTSVNRRSSQNNSPGQINLAVGIFRDAMLTNSDLNNDGKMSSSEIESFYSTFLFYSPIIARHYGQAFVQFADADHDGLLNPSELLQMLIAIDASSTSKR